MNKSNMRIAAGIALSVLTTMIVFWWLINYSILSLADMIGTMVVVYFVGLYMTAAYADKKRKNERKRLKQAKK